MDKKEIISYFMENNILVSPDIVEKLDGIDRNYFLEKVKNQDFLVINQESDQLLTKQDILWKELDKSKTVSEKQGTPYSVDIEDKTPPTNQQVKVTFSYDSEPKKRQLSDFVNLFNARYKSMEKLLSNRMEMTNLTSISRLQNKKDRETVSLIAMVAEKRTTKNGNIMIKAEDPTGTINILVNKNKPDLFKEAEDIVLDEIIAVVGVCGDNIVFANNVLWPEIPLTKELKKCQDEVYAVFLCYFV